jgi:hypothetical protein
VGQEKKKDGIRAKTDTVRDKEGEDGKEKG